MALLLISCAVDRTYEYDLLTKHNKWIYAQMKSQYLWAENLPEQSDDDRSFFGDPADYFAKMIKYGSSDKGSYIDIDTLEDQDNHSRGYFNHSNTYGYDFTIVSDPTKKTTNQYARVVSVADNSPAKDAGLVRGDYIETYDGMTVSSSRTGALQKGKARTYIVRKIGYDEVNECYVWTDSTVMPIEASTSVQEVAFPVCKTFEYQGLKVGYLMCNRLDGETDGETDEVMQKIKAGDVNALVLDLRLCNYGTIEMAQRMASLIVPPSMLTGVFAKTVWNDSLQSNNKTYYFDQSLADKTLDLEAVTVITGSYTQGAAEWLIQALQCALGSENVQIVGKATANQFVMPWHTGDYDNVLHLYPAVAWVLSADEEFDSKTQDVSDISKSAIQPTTDINEFDSYHLYEYGDTSEVLLNTALKKLLAN